jgi:hypothetical protein
MNPNAPGLGLLKARLSSLSLDAVELNLLHQDVPEGTTLAVIAGPRTAFQPEEIERLNAYMKSGGRLLVMADNQVNNGLAEWLKGYNVEMGNGLVLDPGSSVRGRPNFVVLRITAAIRHPIVDSLAGINVLLPNASPMSVVTTIPGFAATPILRTGQGSWAETDARLTPATRPDEKEARGPLTVGVAVTDRPDTAARAAAKARSGIHSERPRLVVLGSRAMANNDFVSRYETNFDLILNAVNWLRERPEQQGAAPKRHVHLQLVADDNLRRRIVLVPTLMSLAVIIAVGVMVFLSRRE